MKFKIERNILILNFNLYVSIFFFFDLVCYELVIEYKVVMIRIIDVFGVILFDLNDIFINDGILVIFIYKLLIEYFVLLIEGLYVSFFYVS